MRSPPDASLTQVMCVVFASAGTSSSTFSNLFKADTDA
jgi:hypothetical protein